MINLLIFNVITFRQTKHVKELCLHMSKNYYACLEMKISQLRSPFDALSGLVELFQANCESNDELS